MQIQNSGCGLLPSVVIRIGHAWSQNAKCSVLPSRYFPQRKGAIFVFFLMLKQAELATHSKENKNASLSGRRILYLSRSGTGRFRTKCWQI
jgi:hypothetical protein